jgi:hypothetical protein
MKTLQLLFFFKSEIGPRPAVNNVDHLLIKIKGTESRRVTGVELYDNCRNVVGDCVGIHTKDHFCPSCSDPYGSNIILVF